MEQLTTATLTTLPAKFFCRFILNADYVWRLNLIWDRWQFENTEVLRRELRYRHRQQLQRKKTTNNWNYLAQILVLMWWFECACDAQKIIINFNERNKIKGVIFFLFHWERHEGKKTPQIKWMGTIGTQWNNFFLWCGKKKGEKRDSREKKVDAENVMCTYCFDTIVKMFLMSVHQHCNAKRCYYFSTLFIILCMACKRCCVNLYTFRQNYPKPSIIHTE